MSGQRKPQSITYGDLQARIDPLAAELDKLPRGSVARTLAIEIGVRAAADAENRDEFIAEFNRRAESILFSARRLARVMRGSVAAKRILARLERIRLGAAPPRRRRRKAKR